MTRHARRGRLQATELAEAVVLADLTLVLAIASQVIPVGSALLVIAVVPMAALAARNRLRAVVAGTVAASTVGFLVLGIPVVTSVITCGALGAVVGISARRGYGALRTVGMAVVFLWPLVALIIDGLLFVFSSYRTLLLQQIHNSWDGLSHALDSLGERLASVPVLRLLPLQTIADRGDQAINRLLADWWITIPALLLVTTVIAVWLAQRLTAPTLRRVRDAFAANADVELGDEEAPEPGAAPAPVPVAFHSVGYRYPGADRDVLHDVTIEVAGGELVAVVGPNGSGKSTLGRLLAGRRPTTGEVVRPGASGLGVPGGTAIVFQRPELQVLGVRVRDDVVWGMQQSGDGQAVDVEGLLARVGLDSFADRETSTLSGGELQRLAVAAALARRPQLLISDESTAMVDGAGRVQLLALLRSLVTRDRMAVVHVTHRARESANADRTIALEAGRVVQVPEPDADDAPAAVSASPRQGDPLLLLSGVGHVYSRNTPWSHRALADVNLRIDRGEAVLVVGHNGSGKSTLAWVLAGLLDPSEGEACLEGEPLRTVVGQVAVAFQHSRLQLLRPTVFADVTAASGAAQAVAWQALADVGFEPSVVGPRRVDELSGGEARRVVIAGALAARPRALVLDEPFAGLDDHARRDLTTALSRLRTERGMTLVCVSHDRDLPRSLVDREIELTGGRISYDGPGRARDPDVAQEKQP